MASYIKQMWLIRHVHAEMILCCLLKGRHSEAAHGIQGCSSPKMFQGWRGGGVCHAGVGWVMENSNLRIFGKSLTFQLNKLYTQSM